MSTYIVKVGDQEITARLISRGDNCISFEVDKNRYDVTIATTLDHGSAAYVESGSTLSSQPKSFLPKKKSGALPGEILAPMPGVVTKINVKLGQSVRAGETIAVIEAMKMENNISANCDGKVAKIMISQGQEVELGQAIASIAID